MLALEKTKWLILKYVSLRESSKYLLVEFFRHQLFCFYFLGGKIMLIGSYYSKLLLFF